MSGETVSASVAAPAAAPLEPPVVRPAVTVARNASMLAAATFVAGLATFVLGVVIGRRLGATQYGYYGLATALGLVLVPVADLGLTPYVVRETARSRAGAEAALGVMLAAKAVIGTVTLALVLALAELFGSNGTLVAVLVVYVLASLLDGVSQFCFGYFQGLERMQLESRLTAAVSLARSVGAIGLILATSRLLPALLWMLALSIAQLAAVSVRMRAMRGAVATGARAARVRWRTVVAMGAITVLTLLYTREDVVLVAWIKDAHAVGLYTAATTIMLGIQLMPWMIGVALGPVFARSHAKGDGLFERSWQEGLRAMLFVALPLALVISLLARPIMLRLFGDGFAGAATALGIIVWCSPLAAFNILLVGALRGAGRERWLVASALGGALFNLGVNLWAIPAYGIAGAAATTIATEVVVCGFLAAVAIRSRIVAPPRLPYAGLILALLALAGAELATRALPLFATIAAALGAYLAVAALTRVMRRSDLAILRQMLSADQLS